MNNQNQNQQIVQEQKPTFSAMLSTKGYQTAVINTLKDPDRAKRFCAAITSAVAVNPALQECDPRTILSGALLGESLNLSPSPQLGQYYLVPFKNKAKYNRQGDLIKPETMDAQFVLGYKGYIQLALRSGQYKHLNVLAIKEGELVRWNPITEDAVLNLIEDEDAREKLPTIGYLAMFEYLNGFRKTIYWSRSKMENHALKYSKGYAAKKGYTFWEKDFDSMAYKTMMRQLISKWGIMSVDMRQAIEEDLHGESLTANDVLADAAPKLNLESGKAPSEITSTPDPEPEEQVSLNDL